LEIIETYGTFHLMRIDRVARTTEFSPLIRSIPMRIIDRDYCKIPNLHLYFENGCYVPRAKLHTIVLPRHVFETSIAYCMRQNEGGYNYTGLCTVLQGKRSELRIGARVVSRAWDADQNTFEDTCFSIFVMGAISRYKRTQNVSRAFAFIQKHGDDTTWSSIVLTFNSFFANLFDRLFMFNGRKRNPFNPSELNRAHYDDMINIVNMPPQYFADQIVDESVDFTRSDFSIEMFVADLPSLAPRRTDRVGACVSEHPYEAVDLSSPDVRSVELAPSRVPTVAPSAPIMPTVPPVTPLVVGASAPVAAPTLIAGLKPGIKAERLDILRKHYKGVNFDVDVVALAKRYEDDFKSYGSFAAGAHQNAQLDPDLMVKLLPPNTLEMFASPLNFNPSLGGYCSKFADDAEFSALGSAFDGVIHLFDNVYANPPFCGDFVQRAIDALAGYTGNVFFVCPKGKVSNLAYDEVVELGRKSFVDGRSFIKDTYGKIGLETDCAMYIRRAIVAPARLPAAAPAPTVVQGSAPVSTVQTSEPPKVAPNPIPTAVPTGKVAGAGDKPKPTKKVTFASTLKETKDRAFAAVRTQIFTNKTANIGINGDDSGVRPVERLAARDERPAVPPVPVQPHTVKQPTVVIPAGPATAQAVNESDELYKVATGMNFDQLCPLFNKNVYSVGHCAMQSVNYFVKHLSPRQFAARLLAHYQENRDTGFYGTTTDDMVQSYFARGDYANEYGDSILGACAAVFDLHISVYRHDQHRRIADKPFLTVGDPAARPIGVLHHTAGGGHFQPLVLRGGASPRVDDKYRELVMLVDDFSNVVDISAAPGFVARVISERQAALNRGRLLACIYKGDGHLQPHKQLLEGIDTVEYQSFNKLVLPHRADTLISDAANEVSEPIITELIANLHRFLKPGGQLICKHFGASPDLDKFIKDNFETGENVRFVSTRETSAEMYWVGRGFVQPMEQIAINKEDIKLFNKELEDSDIPVVRRVLDKTIQPCDFAFYPFLGIPGACKSKYIAQEYPNALWIVPTNELKRSHAKHGSRAVTYHTALTLKEEFAVVVVDEAQTYPLGYFAYVNARFPTAFKILVGDIDQINAINYNNSARFRTLSSAGIKNKIFTTMRMPQDVVNFVNYYYHRGYHTSSTVKTSVEFVSDPPKGMKQFVFNQNEFGIPTIHELMGSTFSELCFHIDDHAISSGLLQRQEHMIVALSRHTNRLVVYDNTTALKRMFEISGSVLDTISEQSQVRLYDEVRLVTTRDELPYVEMETGVAEDKFGADNAMVIDILNRVLPNNNEGYGLVAGYLNTNVKEVASGKLQTNVENLLPSTQVENGYKIPGFAEINKCRLQFSNVQNCTTATMVGRYAKLSKSWRGDEARNHALIVYKNFCRFIFPKDRNPVRTFEGRFLCKEGQLERSLGEYLIKLQSKISGSSQRDKVNCKELEEYFNIHEERIKFFNKKQVKFDPSAEFDCKDKVGQGVAAWSKRMNVLFGAFSRTMHDQLQDIVRTDGAATIILPTEDADHVYGSRVAALEMNAPLNKKRVYSNNDFEEWDSSYNEFLIEFDCLLITALGANEYVVNCYRFFRKHWVLSYGYADFPIKLVGEMKQHSGQPFTLVCNSAGNMALTASLIDFTDIYYALFKGDDGCVSSGGHKYSDYAIRCLDKMGHKLKLHASDVGEFAGFVITPYGMFPDLLRRVAKTVSKIYTSEEVFLEAKLSVGQDLTTIKTQVGFESGCHHLATHYNYLGLTPHDVRILHSYVQRFMTLDFGKLEKVSKGFQYFSA